MAAGASDVLALVRASLRDATNATGRAMVPADVAWKSMTGTSADTAAVAGAVRSVTLVLVEHPVERVHGADFVWPDVPSELDAAERTIALLVDSLADRCAELRDARASLRARLDLDPRWKTPCALCGNSETIVPKADRAAWTDPRPHLAAHDGIKRAVLVECNGCLACYHAIARAARLAVAVLVSRALVAEACGSGSRLVLGCTAEMCTSTAFPPGYVQRGDERAPFCIVTVNPSDVLQIEPTIRRLVKGIPAPARQRFPTLDDAAMTDLARKARERMLRDAADVAEAQQLEALLPSPGACDIAIVVGASDGDPGRFVCAVVRSFAGDARRRPYSRRRQHLAAARFRAHRRKGGGRYGGACTAGSIAGECEALFGRRDDEASAQRDSALSDWAVRAVEQEAYLESASDAAQLFASHLRYQKTAGGGRVIRGGNGADYQQYGVRVRDAVMSQAQLRKAVSQTVDSDGVRARATEEQRGLRELLLHRGTLRARGGAIAHTVVHMHGMRCGRPAQEGASTTTAEDAAAFFPLTALAECMSAIIDGDCRDRGRLARLLSALGADEEAVAATATGEPRAACAALYGNASLRSAVLLALETSTGLTLNRYATSLHEDGQSSGGCELSTVSMMEDCDASYAAEDGALVLLELCALAIAARPGVAVLCELHEWLHCSIGGRGTRTECYLSGPKSVLY